MPFQRRHADMPAVDNEPGRKPGRRMLVCDLDGTLVGEAGATRRLLDWISSRGPDVLLVFNTGRTRRSADHLMIEADLPWPDVLVTGVGTEIAYEGESGPDPTWRDFVSRRWNPTVVEEIGSRYGEALVWQENVAQTDLKKSFELRSRIDLAMIAETLVAAGVDARLVQTGNLLDVVPSQAGKRNANVYLQRRFDIPEDRTAACGDSENDLDMLTGGCHAIVVGNATAGLLAGLGKTRAYRARAFAAAGILEGLVRLGW